MNLPSAPRLKLLPALRAEGGRADGAALLDCSACLRLAATVLHSDGRTYGRLDFNFTGAYAPRVAARSDAGAPALSMHCAAVTQVRVESSVDCGCCQHSRRSLTPTPHGAAMCRASDRQAAHSDCSMHGRAPSTRPLLQLHQVPSVPPQWRSAGPGAAGGV